MSSSENATSNGTPFLISHKHSLIGAACATSLARLCPLLGQPFQSIPARPASRRRCRPHPVAGSALRPALDRKSTRLNSSHQIISYAVFCLKKKKKKKKKSIITKKKKKIKKKKQTIKNN